MGGYLQNRQHSGKRRVKGGQKDHFTLGRKLWKGIYGGLIREKRNNIRSVLWCFSERTFAGLCSIIRSVPHGYSGKGTGGYTKSKIL